MSASKLFDALGLADDAVSGGDFAVRSPIDGAELGRVRTSSLRDLDQKIARAENAFEAWRTVPAPRRGELIRLFGEELRAHKSELGELVRLLGEELRRHKDTLGRLVTLETGKILSEGLGEVQEMIDICDFALGLSRQLYGLTIASERLGHRMMETWHPLGVVGVISAINFPVAVWSWNTALALVCGDSVVWKPSEKAPLTALALSLIHI